MSNKLFITASADRDLEEITTYIAEQLSNIDAAYQLLDEVEARYQKLVENPFLYVECEDKRLKQLGYRKVVVDNYLLLYRYDDDQEIIYIERFFSQLQNYVKML